jgi:hypothetical protein
VQCYAERWTALRKNQSKMRVEPPQVLQTVSLLKNVAVCIL